MKHIKKTEALFEQFGLDKYQSIDLQYVGLVGCFEAKLEMIAQILERIDNNTERMVVDRQIFHMKQILNDIME